MLRRGIEGKMVRSHIVVNQTVKAITVKGIVHHVAERDAHYPGAAEVQPDIIHHIEREQTLYRFTGCGSNRGAH